MARNVVEIILKADDKASAKLKAVGANTKDLGKALSAAGTVMIGAGLAIEGALAGVIMKTAQWGDTIAKMGKKLGVSTEFLSSLEYAIKRSGGEVVSFQTALRTMSQQAYDASKGLAESRRTFDDLGVTIQNTDGTLRSSEALFLDIGDAIAREENQTMRLALATKVFGRGALELMPLLREGRAGIDALMQRARQLNVVLSKESAERAEKFQDALLDVKSSLRGVGLALFDLYGDDLIKFNDRLATQTIPRIKEWIDANEGLAKSIGAIGLGAIGLGLAAKNPLAALVALTGASSLAGFKYLESVINSIQGEMTAERAVPDWLKAWFNYATTGPRMMHDFLSDVHEEQEKGIRTFGFLGDYEAQRLYDAWDAMFSAIEPKINEFADLEQRYAEERKKAAEEARALKWYSAPMVPELGLETVEPIIRDCADAMGIWNAKTRDLVGNIVELTGAFEQVERPRMVNPFADAVRETFHEFDVEGLDVARDLTHTFGSMFTQIAIHGATAAQIFDQAWRQAIGNVAARLAEMAIWQVGGGIVSGLLGGAGGLLGFLFNRGAEFVGAQHGLEVTGGSYGRDTVHSALSRGELVMPSPTVERLRGFLDRAEQSLSGAINVYPLFFSGSRQDSMLAADYISRRLEGNSRFVIEGTL